MLPPGKKERRHGIPVGAHGHGSLQGQDRGIIHATQYRVVEMPEKYIGDEPLRRPAAASAVEENLHDALCKKSEAGPEGQLPPLSVTSSVPAVAGRKSNTKADKGKRPIPRPSWTENRA